MDKLYFLFVLCLLPATYATSQSKNNIDDQGRKQGTWEFVKTDTSEKYNLNVFMKNADGSTEHLNPYPVIKINHRLQARGHYSNGEKTGTWIFFQNDVPIDPQRTQIDTSINNQDTVIYRHRYSIKQKKYEVRFKNNQMHGELVTYDDDGNKTAVITYSQGKPSGDLKLYYPDGNLKFEGMLNPETQYYEGTEYYATGKKRNEKTLHVDYVLKNEIPAENLEKTLSAL